MKMRETARARESEGDMERDGERENDSVIHGSCSLWMRLFEKNGLDVKSVSNLLTVTSLKLVSAATVTLRPWYMLVYAQHM